METVNFDQLEYLVNQSPGIITSKTVAFINQREDETERERERHRERERERKTEREREKERKT